MEKDVFDIVKEKSFIELSETERLAIKEICASEDEYNQMRYVLSEVEQMTEKAVPTSAMKERLDAVWMEEKRPAGGMWLANSMAVIVPKDKPIYRQPLLQAAAVAALFFIAVPFFGSRMESPKAEQMAKLEEKSIEQEVEKPELDKDSSGGASVSDLENTQVQKRIQTRSETYTIHPSSTGGGIIDEVIATVVPEEDMGAAASQPGFSHPDGIFEGVAVAFSQPASDEPDLLDLLTATF